MSFLCAFGLGCELACFHILCAVEVFNLFLGLTKCKSREVDAIGTHVCDLSWFVELLGDTHSVAYRETKLTSRFLLQCWSCEWRCRALWNRFLLHRFDGVTCALAVFQEFICILFLVETSRKFCKQLIFVIVDCEWEVGCHAVSAAVHEVLDLIFTLNDKTYCNTLHATCWKCRFYLLPKKWWKFITYQAVENTTCLLSGYEVHINLTWVVDSVQNCRFCDFVEHDTAIFIFAQAQSLIKMPWNWLSLTVLIGSQPHHISACWQLFQFRNKVFFIVRDLIFRHEAVVHIQTQIRFVQIPYMSVTRFNCKFFTQKAFNCLCLRRRLNYHKILYHITNIYSYLPVISSDRRESRNLR